MAKVFEADRGHKPCKGLPVQIKTEPLVATALQGAPAVPIMRQSLIVEERKERTAKGLCFNYDDKYVPGHRCKGSSSV